MLKKLFCRLQLFGFYGRRKGGEFSPFVLPFVIIAMAISLPIAANAASSTPQIITEIRERYKTCRQLRDEKTGFKRMYGVFKNLTDQERPVWHLSPPEDGMVLLEIVLYSAPGQQTGFAELAEFTPSGDWSKLSEYCFRNDGSVAFIFSDYRTFFGDVRVEDRLYYDSYGHQVRNTRRIFDLETGERLPDDMTNFMDRETLIFFNVEELATELGNGISDD